MCMGSCCAIPFENIPGDGIIIIPPGGPTDAAWVGAAPLELAVTAAALAGL
jgi:hypothetical protein